jgi:hypothetical protein
MLHVTAALLAALWLAPLQPLTSGRSTPSTARSFLRAVAQDLQTSARTVTGRVVDAETGEALRGVEVRVGSLAPVATDVDGRFRVEHAPAGDITLNVSTVGYALARRTLRADDAAADLLVPLVRGTGAYTERVTVSAESRVPHVAGVVVRSLQSRELQELGSVLADDPLRAAQALPGVAWNDDFRAELSIRGHGPRHIGFSIDDVPTPWLVHSIVGRGDDTGSIALINSDVLERLQLSAGVRPQRLGDRAGAWLETTLREGSRDAVGVRGALSFAGASTVVEGPLGKSRRGSWLVSARQSYLDWLLRRITDEGDQTPIFGFTDTQSKFAFDFTPSQRIQVTVIGGRSRLDEREDSTGPNSISRGNLRTGLATVGWQSAVHSSLLVAQRGWVTQQRFTNVGFFEQELSGGWGRELGYRTDVTWTPTPRVLLDVGASASTRTDSQLFTQYTSTGTPPRVVPSLSSSLSGRATSNAAYSQATWTAADRASVSAGIRFTRFGLIDEAATSPWVMGAVSIAPGTRLRAGASVQRQSPDVLHVSGVNGNPQVHGERSRLLDLGVEHTQGSWRFDVQLYDRRDDNVLRLTEADSRLVGGRLVLRTLTGRFFNSLAGTARGIETTIERRSAQGCGGWASYTYGRTQVTDALQQETYWADYDQRHALNGYLYCQPSARWRFSAKLRLGSNFPVPGYLARVNDVALQVAEQRNDVRLPQYQRLDLNVSRAFVFSKRRLTLFAEAMNATGRINLRANSGTIRTRTGEAVGFTESLLPRIPVAGLLVEF